MKHHPLGFNMKVLSDIYNFFLGTSIPYDPAPVAVDPRVQKVLNVLNSCPLARELLNEIEVKKLNVKVVPLSTKEECNKKNFERSVLNIQKGGLFKSDQFEILFDASLEFESQIQSVLIEYCNLAQANKFIQLDNEAKAGKIGKNSYAFSRESIEYNSFKRFVEIGEAIENANLVLPQSIVSDKERLQAKSLTEYLRVVNRSGHREVYERKWKSFLSA